MNFAIPPDSSSDEGLTFKPVQSPINHVEVWFGEFMVAATWRKGLGFVIQWFTRNYQFESEIQPLNDPKPYVTEQWRQHRKARWVLAEPEYQDIHGGIAIFLIARDVRKQPYYCS